MGMLFKKVNHQSILQYLIRVRMDEAVRLITEGQYRITDIAKMVGYPDVFYFSKRFKKRMGFRRRNLSGGRKRNKNMPRVIQKKYSLEWFSATVLSDKAVDGTHRNCHVQMIHCVHAPKTFWQVFDLNGIHLFASLLVLSFLLMMESFGVIKGIASLTVYGIPSFFRPAQNAFAYLSDLKLCLKFRQNWFPQDSMVMPIPAAPEL